QNFEGKGCCMAGCLLLPTGRIGRLLVIHQVRDTANHERSYLLIGMRRSQKAAAFHFDSHGIAVLLMQECPGCGPLGRHHLLTSSDRIYERSRSRSLDTTPDSPVPVWLAADGSRSLLELMGRLADIRPG